jgi:ATP-binding cassette subfamily B protein
MLRTDGWLAPGALVLALALAAGGVVIEALLLRGLFDIGRELSLTGQRLGAMVALVAFVAALLCLEWPIMSALLRMSRRLETRLRLAFLAKLPRLVDRYFQSRLTSDMAERCHSLHEVRRLPELGGRFLRLSFELVFTAAGIAWLDPRHAPLAFLAALVAVAVPVGFQPLLSERDLRMRTHLGALGRFYLDALLGLVAVRAHGAERAVRAEHESLLAEWARAGIGLQRHVVVFEAIQMFLGFSMAIGLVFSALHRGGEPTSLILTVYWALHLPVLGQDLGLLLRQYPSMRSVTLRLFEPLGAQEEQEAAASGGRSASVQTQGLIPDMEARAGLSSPGSAVGRETARCAGVDVHLEQASVRIAGHTVLEEVNVDFAPGDQVAIVGASGAGKSTLVGLLLGWHRPSTGRLLVGGFPLVAGHLAELRRHTVWVDPAVQLWNRSLLDNLRYGQETDAEPSLGMCLDQADLLGVLERLPNGLQTSLGEGGGLLSGGEGQRVRFGRGLLRTAPRLVILDEPFRGLDREQRRLLLLRARERWRGVTLLCITHDVGETVSFPRVLVIDRGRIVEDADPRELSHHPDSIYASLLQAEQEVRKGLWSDRHWRRCRMEMGRVVETNAADTTSSCSKDA